MVILCLTVTWPWSSLHPDTHPHYTLSVVLTVPWFWSWQSLNSPPHQGLTIVLSGLTLILTSAWNSPPFYVLTLVLTMHCLWSSLHPDSCPDYCLTLFVTWAWLLSVFSLTLILTTTRLSSSQRSDSVLYGLKFCLTMTSLFASLGPDSCPHWRQRTFLPRTWFLSSVVAYVLSGCHSALNQFLTGPWHWSSTQRHSGSHYGLTPFPLFSFLFLKFIYFNWRLVTLQYCSGFAIHWHESAMSIHVFPIVNPLNPIPLGCPQAPALSVPSHALNLDWRFVSHLVIHMFQCRSPKSSHPRLLPQSPKDCSLHWCLFWCFTYRVIITIFLNSIYMH